MKQTDTIERAAQGADSLAFNGPEDEQAALERAANLAQISAYEEQMRAELEEEEWRFCWGG
jgi:hypothetical protein